MSPTRIFRRRFTRAGAIPGHFEPPPESPPPRLYLFSFDVEELEERTLGSITEAKEAFERNRAGGRTTWLDVQGLGDAEMLGELDDIFGLHHLALADAVNVGQRPKIDDYGDTLYAALRMVTIDDGDVHWEQVSVFLGAGFVLTVQERPGDCLEPVRERLRRGRPRIRSSKPDYLAVMIIDAIVDGCFPVLEAFGEHLEELESRIVRGGDPDALGDVYDAKRGLLALRRATWPLRDALSQTLRAPPPLLSEVVLPYLRDAADHTMQIVDVTETYRELASSLVDVHLSSVANRTNEIMRVLTILASIFVPLTFLAGIYGMNFETGDEHPLNLPELAWRYGYIAFWIVSLILAGGMLLMFRRLGWLGGVRRDR